MTVVMAVIFLFHQDAQLAGTAKFMVPVSGEIRLAVLHLWGDARARYGADGTKYSTINNGRYEALGKLPL